MAHPEPPIRRSLALTVIVIGILITAVDTTIVVLALPTMMRSLHADLTGVVWVIMAYLLVITVPETMAFYTMQAGRTVFPTVCAGVSHPGTAAKPSQDGPCPAGARIGAAEDRGIPLPRPPSEGRRPRALSARRLRLGRSGPLDVLPAIPYR